MSLITTPDGGPITESTDPSLTFLGNPSPPPAPPSSQPTTNSAPPTLGSAPTVSSTPNPGQGVALTAGGVLPPSARATGLRVLTADPISPLVGEFWYRSDTKAFCIRHNATTTVRVTLA